MLNDQLSPGNLEGLVLRDGDGRYYEVPRVVIERYRMADADAAGLSRSSHDSSASPGANGLPAGALPWSIHDGIYLPARAEPDRRGTP